MVFERARPDEPWQASALATDDVLPMPEIGIEIPVAEFYEGVASGDAELRQEDRP